MSDSVSATLETPSDSSKPVANPPASSETQSEKAGLPTHSAEASPEITTQDIYRPISSSTGPEDQSSNSGYFPTDNDRTLYVSELDQSVNEADLFKVFSTYGQISSIRVVKDPFSKRSLGYAYVNYKEKENAQSALSHDFKYIKSKPCRVTPFEKDPSLRKTSTKADVFIKNLDPTTTSAALLEAFSPFGAIVSCKVAGDENTPNHRGFGYVNYEDPEAAAEAILRMNGEMLNDRAIIVSHHISKRDRMSKVEELKANFTNLYIKNIELHTTDQEFRELFAAHGELLSYSLPLDDEGLSRGFGFVNFKTHEQAVAAVEALNDYEFHGKLLYVSRAQKKYEREEELRQQYEMARMRRVAEYASTNLYIKYLDPSINDDILREAFSPFGVITSARVMTDDNGNSRGFGFVCYSNSEEAQRAIGEMHNREFKGKNLYVTIAQRRDSRKPPLMPLHPFFANGMGVGPILAQVPNQQPPSQLNENDQSSQKQQQMAPNASLHMPQQYNNQTRQSSRTNQQHLQQQQQMRNMPIGAPGQFVNPYYYSLPSNFMGAAPPAWTRGAPMVGPNGEPLVFAGAPPYGFPAMAMPGNGGFRNAGAGKQGFNNGYNSPSGGSASTSKHGSPRQGSRNTRGNNGGNKQGNNSNNNGYQSKPNPQLLYGSTLSAVVASAASPEAEKQAIGEALYPKIQRHPAVKGDTELSAKLTGMMLDLDTTELLKWVDDDVILNTHIQQAYDQYMEFLSQPSSSK